MRHVMLMQNEQQFKKMLKKKKRETDSPQKSTDIDFFYPFELCSADITLFFWLCKGLNVPQLRCVLLNEHQTYDSLLEIEHHMSNKMKKCMYLATLIK